MKPGQRREPVRRIARVARADARDASSPDRAAERAADRAAERAAAWTLTPAALIPFGSFVPPRARRSGQPGDRR